MVCGSNNRIHHTQEIHEIFPVLGCTVPHRYLHPLADTHRRDLLDILPITIHLPSFTMRIVRILLCRAAWALELLMLPSRISCVLELLIPMLRVRCREQALDPRLVSTRVPLPPRNKDKTTLGCWKACSEPAPITDKPTTLVEAVSSLD